MALIKDGRVTVVLGLTINALFLVLKFVTFLYSHVRLFFADAIDSFADSFVILLLLLFLRFDLSNHMTFLNMDIMFFCQWSAIIIFRVIILLEQISDLIQPEAREAPLLTIIVSCVVLGFGVLLAILFVDEDDVLKCFIEKDEKLLRKAHKAQQKALLGDAGKKTNKRKSWKIMPIFAEALDNFATTLVALVVGILLKQGIIVDHLYLIDDIGNMVISVVMMAIASNGLWQLSEQYRDKSYFQPLFTVHNSTASTQGAVSHPQITPVVIDDQ